MSKLLPRNNKNVYILGAGFSAMEGLPTTATFLDHMRDALAETRVDAARQDIEQVLKFKREHALACASSIPMNSENIEDLFSLASSFQDEQLDTSFRSALAYTLQWSREKGLAKREKGAIIIPDFRNASEPRSRAVQILEDNAIAWGANGTPPSRFDVPMSEYFVGLIAGGLAESAPGQHDVVITFNYDTIIEEACGKFHVAYDYGLKDPAGAPQATDAESRSKSLTVLKLHGSINWGALPGSVDIHPCKTFDDVIGGGMAPVIVPPTLNKAYTPALRSVWARARNHIADATRIYVFGYSYPQTDAHFKYLLAAAFGEQLWLRAIHWVDLPDAPILGRLSSLFGPEVYRKVKAHDMLFGVREFLCTKQGSLRRHLAAPLSPVWFAT